MVKVFKIPVLICHRCNHSWRPRTEEIHVCPSCKSPYWNKPRKNKQAKRSGKIERRKQAVESR